jgi:hypothetical protein
MTYWKFISHSYVEISQLIRNKMERYRNDSYDISFTKRSNKPLFWQVLNSYKDFNIENNVRKLLLHLCSQNI